MKETPTLVHLLLEVLNEYKLNTSNAVDIQNGRFKVGDIEYIIKYDKLNINGIEVPDIGFDQVGNTKPNLPIGNTKKTEVLKVYSTMYKAILDYLEEHQPKLFGISCLAESGYHTIYSWLSSKENYPPNYFKVNNRLEVSNDKGQKLYVILFKRYS
jgi:hypothetical protein